VGRRRSHCLDGLVGPIGQQRDDHRQYRQYVRQRSDHRRGTGGAIGTFTGGTITSTGADVAFVSGAIHLGDNIQVGSHTATNSGATISLANNVVVNGNFRQSSGTLDLKGYVLTVNGAADVSGGVVAAALSSTSNYLSGQTTTLISGASVPALAEWSCPIPSRA
jgi:hypothetical protein